MSDDDDRSDSEGSSASSEEDIVTTGLIATRARRANAGNLLQTLLANIDDEEVQELLVSEGEEEEDYDGSEGRGRGGDDDEDDDDAMESSSDEGEDGDAGPPKEGEVEELDGEKELKRVERAAAKSKKRKADQARLNLPAWQKKRADKKLRLAEDGKGEGEEDEAAVAARLAAKQKKKSERVSWLDSVGVRQSHRTAAITSREITNANLAQSAARAEKQRTTMKDAAERARASKRVDLTQEQRMAKVTRIEKETEKEFGRWEREEAERQRIREEQLAAKRRRGVDVDPTITHWSGSVLWEGEKIKIPRIKPKALVEQITIEEETPQTGEKDTPVSGMNSDGHAKTPQDAGPATIQQQQPSSSEPLNATHSEPVETSTTTSTAPASPSQQLRMEQDKQIFADGASWLEGIQAYAEEPNKTEPDRSDQPPSITEKAVEVKVETNEQPATQRNELLAISSTSADVSESTISQPSDQDSANEPSQRPSFLPSDSMTTASFIAFDPSTIKTEERRSSTPQQNLSTTQQLLPAPVKIQPAPPPPPPPVPLLREQAQRTLILLTNFANLDSAPGPTKRVSKKDLAKNNPLQDPVLIPNPLLNPLMSDSPSGTTDTHPTFNQEQARYLTVKMKKLKSEPLLPAAPPKPRCALTAWPAKYRDPRTGLPYADLQTYKMIQRLLAGGCAWSGFLGAWVGPWYGETGRPARGVPMGFGD